MERLSLVVTTAEDKLAPTINLNDLSLREAILLANENPGPDVIAFDTDGVFAIPQTISLTLGQLLITESVSVFGSGAGNLTIDAMGSSRVLLINDGTARELQEVELHGVTISGGMAVSGGGILNRDHLSIFASVVTHNSATFGGGIASQLGGLTIEASTISHNSAERGGGIHTYTDLSGIQTTITNSTISGNTANSAGGGILNANGLTVIRNSTVTDNSLGGVASIGSSRARSELFSTLVAGNGQSDVDTFLGATNSFLSLGHNLIGFGNALGAFSATLGDQTEVADPLVAPLAANGGPTPTHALLPGSPAIDTGNLSISLEFDQRGAPFARANDGRTDVGAFERQVLELIVDTTRDERDEDLSPGDLSLREAIGLANSNPGRDVIRFDTATVFATPQTVALELGQLAISDSVDVLGHGARHITIDGQGRSRVLFVADGNAADPTEALVQGVTITGGNAVFGGGILNRANLTLTESVVSGNAGTFGGGIRNSGGTLMVARSNLLGNIADRGAGIDSDTDSSGNVTEVSNTTISGNTATVAGGGLYNFDGLTIIENSTITDNSAPPAGGAGVAGSGLTSVGTEILSTIISGNDGTDIDFLNGDFNSFISLGFNLVGSGNAVEDAFGNNDQTNIDDPQLGPLEDNGGPTLTYAVLATSPALDAGDNFSELISDQRGVPFQRVFGTRADVGAFERQSLNLVVDIVADESDGNRMPGDLSLREAVQLANINPSPDNIRFDTDGVFSTPQTIAVVLGQISITDSVRIAGHGADQVRVDAEGRSRVILVSDNDDARTIDVGISGVTIAGGREMFGAGILSRENLTLTETIVSENHGDFGGGIRNRDGNLVIERSTLVGNSARNTEVLYSVIRIERGSRRP